MRARAKGMLWRYLRALGGALLVLAGLLIWQTWAALRPFPPSLLPDAAATRRAQAVDRHGLPLSVTFQNPWNVHDTVSLHDIPLFLQQAFIAAEDKRFYEHQGVDWRARVHALEQNSTPSALSGARASPTRSSACSIPVRTVWSRWVEGFEAMRPARFQLPFSNTISTRCRMPASDAAWSGRAPILTGMSPSVGGDVGTGVLVRARTVWACAVAPPASADH
jgi:hypothetical protein